MHYLFKKKSLAAKCKRLGIDLIEFIYVNMDMRMSIGDAKYFGL